MDIIPGKCTFALMDMTRPAGVNQLSQIVASCTVFFALSIILLWNILPITRFSIGSSKRSGDV